MFDFSLNEVGGKIRTCRINPWIYAFQRTTEGGVFPTLRSFRLLLLLLALLDLLRRLLRDLDLHVVADIVGLGLTVLLTHLEFLPVFGGLSP
ncbi:hypothetical protein EMIT0180MI3_350084 [Priestia megaterium]